MNTQDALALHQRLLTLDTHIDIPWPEGPDPFEETRRCVDMPKMLRGGLSAGCFAAYVPQGPRTPEGHAGATRRAGDMLRVIRGMGRRVAGLSAQVTVTADQVEAARQAGALAIIPAVENGYAVGTDLGNIARFHELGARYLTLTHNGHNALADSAIPRPDLGDAAEEHGGLSPLGRQAIGELNRLGMLVDVSHVSRNGMLQAAALSNTPVVATHSCIRALCDHPRNLDDVQLDVLRETGGLVQITAVPGFLVRRGRAETVTVNDYVDHVEYAVRRIGIAHVGLSSDFDGGGGFTGWHDAGETPNLTAALLQRGFGQDEIAALWSGNFLRLMRRAEAEAE
jgi:membrane dipeptidase